MPLPLPAPEAVRSTFRSLFEIDPEKATAYLHELGVASGYLDADAAARNISWTGASPYGELECTINLAKPEKDPRAIAAAVASGSAAAVVDAAVTVNTAADGQPSTPLCDLCWENEGFAGEPERPAKPGLRIAAIQLGNECWGMQYSPYAYFPEHCIALCEKHRPMKIDEACFERLLDFVDAFPFYFIGSNADLPIVGGSILSHDHFQGGRHVFPLMKAPVENTFALRDMPEVRCATVRWPASVIRLAAEDRSALVQAAAKILRAWQNHSDGTRGIAAFSGNTPHNTLNPIVRKEGSTYVMDLVLRNNRTDAEHPWGIFHPAEELHHLKKENIGLIEIMGLAILPPRLARELPLVQEALVGAVRRGASSQELENCLREQGRTAPHAAWASDVLARRAADLTASKPDGRPGGSSRKPQQATQTCLLHPVIQQEVALVFTKVLETCGVFKRDASGEAGWDMLLAKLTLE